MSGACVHRAGFCCQLAPGIQQCQCGQLFVFLQRGQCGRYKKVEEVTEEDLKHFSPEAEQDFLTFIGRR